MEEGRRCVPRHTGISDTLAVDEWRFIGVTLLAGFEVTFEHDAANLSGASRNLCAQVGHNLGLSIVVLARVAVAAIDH